MKILVVNAGSSSLKYQLFDMDTNEVLAKGLCERIGLTELYRTSVRANLITRQTRISPITKRRLRACFPFLPMRKRA